MSSLRDIELFLEDVEKELYAEPMNNITDSTRNANDSADDQIDSFLIKFEEDSIIAEEEELMESLSNMDLKIFLEQDNPAKDAEAAEGDEIGVAVDREESEPSKPQDPTGSERMGSEEGEDPPMLPIDVDTFTKKVARLVMNAETLLDVKTVIVNRALNYLTENYDEQHAKRMLETLDQQFDFNIDDPGKPPEAPYAVGAYAGGTGGLGGG
jgi:hypothetical protein